MISVSETTLETMETTLVITSEIILTTTLDHMVIILLSMLVFKALSGMEKLVFTLVLTSMLVPTVITGMVSPASTMVQTGTTTPPFVNMVNFGTVTPVSTLTITFTDQVSPLVSVHQVTIPMDTIVFLLLLHLVVTLRSGMVLAAILTHAPRPQLVKDTVNQEQFGQVQDVLVINLIVLLAMSGME